MKIRFESEAAAEAALKATGFSLGTMQRDAPRGVMHGDFNIQKWRNLDATDRAAFHGIYQRAHRDGPVDIQITHLCPEEHANALAAHGETIEEAEKATA